jgi:hypothetical protein
MFPGVNTKVVNTVATIVTWQVVGDLQVVGDGSEYSCYPEASGTRQQGEAACRRAQFDATGFVSSRHSIYVQHAICSDITTAPTRDQQ